MEKIRLVVTATRVYEANPDNYEGCANADEMAALDESGDIFDLLDHEDTQYSVKPA